MENPQNSTEPIEKVLARCEWYLQTDPCTVPEGQLIPMLNYEYARCYKPVVAAFKLLKGGALMKMPDGSNVPTFARYLSHVFPEFPLTPWLELNPKVREERLARLGITKTWKLYFEEPAWQAWCSSDPDWQFVMEGIADFKRETDGVFKLDWSQDDKTIRKAFAKWLTEGRRKQLNQVFQPKKVHLPKGRGNKKRKCHDFLKALGGLRALRYYEDDWAEAEEKTAIDDDKYLYDGQKAWRRAETQAGKMMLRLGCAWKHYDVRYDAFDYTGLTHLLVPWELQRKISDSEPTTQEERTVIRRFLEAHFTLEALDEIPLTQAQLLALL